MTSFTMGPNSGLYPSGERYVSRTSRVEQAAFDLLTALQTIKREGQFSDLEELAILAELLNGRAGVLVAMAAIKSRAMADDEIEKMLQDTKEGQ